MEKSHVVLLGATGFLGKATQEELERHGDTVLGYGSATLDLCRPESLDLLRSVVRPNTVLMVSSAITRDRVNLTGEKVGDSVEAFEANVSMMARVTEFLREASVGKCIYVSSESIYGDHRTNLSLTEETPADPHNLYATVKLAGEFMLRCVAEEKKIPLVIVRLSRIYGPGDYHLSYGPARFIKSALEKQVIELFGQGEERRDFLFIQDAAQLVCRFVHGSWTGVYNLASGECRSFAEVAALIQRFASQPVRVVHCERQRPVITHIGFDLGKLRRVFPDFRPTSLEEGLRTTISKGCCPVGEGDFIWRSSRE